MTDLVLLVLLTMAVARLCVLMVDDDITNFLRDWVYTRFGGDHLLFKGANCHWCWSIWFAFPMAFLTYPPTSLREVWINIVTALAVSFAASKLADWGTDA